MTDKEGFYTFIGLVVWSTVWVCIVAVLKARQSEEEKAKEGKFLTKYDILPYMSDTEFWIGMSIWWPVLLALSPFYLLYKAVFHIAKPKEKKI